MITREEALAKADWWINGGVPPEERLEVDLYEFKHGYVVWRIEPVDERGIPTTVGSAAGVIDKETGELSVWPPLPAEVIAEQYSAKRT